MTEADILLLRDSDDSAPHEQLPLLIKLMADEAIQRRRFRKNAKFVVPLMAALIGGGSFGGWMVAPVPDPVIVPATTADESEWMTRTDRAIKGLRVDVSEGKARDERLEEVLIDGLEWMGDALSRKKGKPIPEWKGPLKDARDRVYDRRTQQRDDEIRKDWRSR